MQMESALVLVSGVPADFSPSDLREFFDEPLQADEFVCFHYVSRPDSRPEPVESSGEELSTYLMREQARDEMRGAIGRSLSSDRCCCMVQMRSPELAQRLCTRYDGARWHLARSAKCHVEVLSGSLSNDASVVVKQPAQCGNGNSRYLTRAERRAQLESGSIRPPDSRL